MPSRDTEHQADDGDFTLEVGHRLQVVRNLLRVEVRAPIRAPAPSFIHTIGTPS